MKLPHLPQHLSPKQKKNAHYWMHLLLFGSNLIGLSYIFLVAYYNRLALDDYCELYMYQRHGFFTAVKIWYNQWTISVALKPITVFFINASKYIHSLWVYIILLTTLFIWVFYRLINTIQQTLNLQKQPWFNLQLSIFIFWVLFNSFFNPSTYFWVTASVGYCFTLTCFLQIITFLLSPPKPKVLSYFFTGLSALFIGNGSINLAFTLLILLGLLMLFLLFEHPWQVNKKQLVKKVCFVLVICLTGITVTLLAPGVYARKAMFPEISIAEAFRRSLGAIQVLSALIQDKLKYFLILLLPMVYVGTLFRTPHTQNDAKVTGWFLLGLPLLLIIIWVATLPTIYAIGSIGPLRSLTHLSLYIVCYVVSFGFLIGYQTMFSKKLAFVLACSSFFYLCVIGLKKIKDDVPQVAQYAKSYDQRMAYIKKLKAQGHTQKVVLPPLAQPNYTIIATDELSQSSNYWVNSCLQNALELKFELTERQTKK
ncbi:DUF6056 family protein [Microscilla marina]|uniref:Membrane protein, putative n=1 Tax=Microscilla marina ATCC 23134 TaxID=313606 RepID=A1ZLX9_MICM2|nr:DUF6056 family protein [Microscilla marina]EAY28511.1 membrane protein, putative [Microscilla marina ATCC 23134]